MDNLFKRVEDAININIIASHAQARAIKNITAVKLIEMKDVVALTFNHKKVITWQ